MIGDHHGRTAGRATLLVRAADGILGTHNVAEDRLGPRLPASLTAFYRLLGWRRDLASSQGTLIALNSLAVVEGPQYGA
jgi:hypothetical protein